jgi:hypothetical protein
MFSWYGLPNFSFIIILWTSVLVICLICRKSSLEKNFHCHRCVAYWLDTTFCVWLSDFSCFPAGRKQQQTALRCWNNLNCCFLFYFVLHYLYTYPTLGGKLCGSLYVTNVALVSHPGAITNVYKFWSLRLFLCIISNNVFCMGVKLGRLHWGRNVGWGCFLNRVPRREYLGLRGTR